MGAGAGRDHGSRTCCRTWWARWLCGGLTRQSPAAILAESVLSFLGFGVSATHTPTWGNMLGGNEGFMTVAPWLVMGAGHRPLS